MSQVRKSDLLLEIAELILDKALQVRKEEKAAESAVQPPDSVEVHENEEYVEDDEGGCGDDEGYIEDDDFFEEDEPAAPATTPPAFQVGDRVKGVGTHDYQDIEGLYGTIHGFTDRTGIREYAVEFPGWGQGHHLHFHEEVGLTRPDGWYVPAEKLTRQ